MTTARELSQLAALVTVDANNKIIFASSSEVELGGLQFPSSDGTNGQVLTTDGAGNVTFQDAASPYGDTEVASYLSTNGYDTATNIISSITDSAPATLDTLNELAAALGDDANFSTTVTNSIATKIGNVVEDTTPQLGGNLDTNGFEIAPADTANNADADNFTIHAKNSTNSFATDGGGNLVLKGGYGYSGGDVTVIGGDTTDVSGLAGDVIISGGQRDLIPYSGDVKIQGLTYPSSDGTNGQVLTTDGSGNLTFADASSGASSLNELSDVYYDSGLNLGIGSASYSFEGSNCFRNIALGVSAGDSITSGDDNIFFGLNAGTTMSTGSQNIAIGRYALDTTSNITGAIAIGYEASQYLPTSYTVAIGYQANRSGYLDEQSVYIGYQAGYGSGSYSGSIYNTQIGPQAGYGIWNGDYNTMIGQQAGYTVNGGGENAFIGQKAGYGTSTNWNSFVGAGSGEQADGSGNTSLGYRSGRNLDGDYNVAIGYYALDTSSVTGSYNISIGFQSQTSSASASNELVFGAENGQAGEITRLRIPGMGLDSGTATSGQVLTADGSGGASFQDAAGGSETVGQILMKQALYA
jgi:hypothetical protein